MNKIYKLKIEDNKIVMDEDFISTLQKIFSGGRISFFLGAGFSADILSVLYNKEIVFEALRHYRPKNKIIEKKLYVLTAYMYWDYFTNCIFPIASITTEISNEYSDFAKILYTILSEKNNPALDKQCNIFTTNYDPIIEILFDNSNCICNDGFEGRICPIFSTDNYSKTYYRQALLSNRKAEIPSINLIKLHGSVTWCKDKTTGKITYKNYMDLLSNFEKQCEPIFDSTLLDNLNKEFYTITEANSSTVIENILNGSILDGPASNYLQYKNMTDKYKNDFLIVNPTKEKFRDTLLNKNYYELMRIYSNELEKENSILIVNGFSFNDEHILDITRRSMLNPSLKIIIFCFEEDKINAYEELFDNSKNNNITYICLDGDKLNLKRFNEILSCVHS